MLCDSHFIRKASVFFASVVIMAFGVILSTKAVLGTSPISSIPFVLTLGTSISIGLTTILVNTVMIVLGIIIMGRMYKPVYLTQIVMLVIFSIFCDVFASLFNDLTVSGYVFQWGMVVLAAFTLSIGISLELAANLTMMPGEYLVSFIAIRTGIEFGKVKVMFDVSMITIAILLSLWYFGELNGVREGTVFAAVTVGMIVRVFTCLLKNRGFYDWIGHVDISDVKPLRTPKEA